MNCCNKVKSYGGNKRFSGMRGDQLRSAIEKEIGTPLRGKNDEITHLVKNFEVFADQDSLELHKEAFK